MRLEFLVQESLEGSNLVRSKQPFTSTCISTMTTEASLKPPPDGRYRPTVSTTSSALLSQLSFIAESPNENDVELTEIRHFLRFETDCNVPVLNILKTFIEQLLLLDPNAYLLSKDHKQHFISVADLPTTPNEIQKTFPATILNRRSGNRLVLRLTACCTKSFLELTQLGIITWANRNKLRLESDIYKEDDVRDCLWIAGRDSKTSKPILHSYLSEVLQKATFDNEEQLLLTTYRSKHNLNPQELPTFSIYWRNRIAYNKLTTSALVFRCDATIQKFFVKFFTRANKCGFIPEKKGRFIPLAVTKNNENATKWAMDGHNKYLTNTISIPVIGLSFEALQTEIEVEEAGRTTIESIIYQNCLSLEPTAKSNDLGRFNLIVAPSDKDSILKFLQNDIPIMWSLLPDMIANKFNESHHIPYPRLTTGFSGLGSSITLEDPQSIASHHTPDTLWTQPPNIQRPPRYVSVIYKAEDLPPPRTRSPKTNHTNKPSSDKSQISTVQSDSELSTLISSIKEEMNREFQAHTELISALKEEISQLRHSNQPTPSSHSHQGPNTVNTEQQNIILSLRQEIKELRNTVQPEPPPVQDFTKLITAVVENMVPLITAAVRQGLESDSKEPSKRSRMGSTPTHLRLPPDIQPTNLMQSYYPTPELPLANLMTDNLHESTSIPPPSPSSIAPPESPSAPRGEEMEE